MILEAGRYFGFGGVCGCPNRGRSLSDPGYFSQMWKQRSVSAVSIQFAVMRAAFLVDLLEHLPRAGFLAVPWGLGGGASRGNGQTRGVLAIPRRRILSRLGNARRPRREGSLRGNESPPDSRPALLFAVPVSREAVCALRELRWMNNPSSCALKLRHQP